MARDASRVRLPERRPHPCRGGRVQRARGRRGVRRARGGGPHRRSRPSAGRRHALGARTAACLGGVAHLLAGVVGRVRIAASPPGDRDIPWGLALAHRSPVVVEPHRGAHAGRGIRRVDKLRAIADEPLGGSSTSGCAGRTSHRPGTARAAPVRARDARARGLRRARPPQVFAGQDALAAKVVRAAQDAGPHRGVRRAVTQPTSRSGGGAGGAALVRRSLRLRRPDILVPPRPGALGPARGRPRARGRAPVLLRATASTPQCATLGSARAHPRGGSGSSPMTRNGGTLRWIALISSLIGSPRSLSRRAPHGVRGQPRRGLPLQRRRSVRLATRGGAPGGVDVLGMPVAYCWTPLLTS